jgi:hypothetical protein
MNEKAVRQLIEIVEKRRATFVRAEILDRDNQLLATGEASPASEGVRQVFHTDNPKEADILESRAAILRRLDGTSQKILRCERCPNVQYSLHFHLEVHL